MNFSRLLQEGRGPHGIVYQVKQNGGAVALKRFHADPSLQKTREFRTYWNYLKNEVKSCRGDHIASITLMSLPFQRDKTSEPDNGAYIFSKFRKEKSLRQLLNRGYLQQPNPHTVAQIISCVQKGLKEAEITHGNLKPENLLVGQPFDRNQLWNTSYQLADFCQLGFPLSTVTAQKYAFGEGWRYIAPEIARNLDLLKKPAELPATVDVFSLAVLIYEVIVGEVPYRARKKSFWVPLDIPLPSPPANWNWDNYSSGFWEVLLQGLHTSADREYADVETFAQDLLLYLNLSGRPDHNTGDSPAQLALQAPVAQFPSGHLQPTDDNSNQLEKSDRIEFLPGNFAVALVDRTQSITLGNQNKREPGQAPLDISLLDDRIAAQQAILTHTPEGWRLINLQSEESMRFLERSNARFIPDIPQPWSNETVEIGPYQLTLKVATNRAVGTIQADLLVESHTPPLLKLILLNIGNESRIFKISFVFPHSYQNEQNGSPVSEEEQMTVLHKGLVLAQQLVRLDPDKVTPVNINFLGTEQDILAADYPVEVKVVSVIDATVSTKAKAIVRIPKVYGYQFNLEVPSLNGRLVEKGTVTARIFNTGNSTQQYMLAGASTGIRDLRFYLPNPPQIDWINEYVPEFSQPFELGPRKNIEIPVTIEPLRSRLLGGKRIRLKNEAQAALTVVPLDGQQAKQVENIGIDMAPWLNSVPKFFLFFLLVASLVLVFILANTALIPLARDLYRNPVAIKAGDDRDSDGHTDLEEIARGRNLFIVEKGTELSNIFEPVIVSTRTPTIEPIETVENATPEPTPTAVPTIQVGVDISSWTVVEQDSLSGEFGSAYELEDTDTRVDMLYLGDSDRNAKHVVIGCVPLSSELSNANRPTLKFFIARQDEDTDGFGAIVVEHLTGLANESCPNGQTFPESLLTENALNKNLAHLGSLSFVELLPASRNQMQLELDLEKLQLRSAEKTNIWFRLEFELATDLDESADLLKLISHRATIPDQKPIVSYVREGE